MKYIITGLYCLLVYAAGAQTVINKTYPLAAGQQVELNFDYPKTVRISTWDKNEVAVTAHVSINDGENDEAFVLEESNANGVLTIRNQIKNMKDLPHRYTVMQDGKKTTFRTKEDYKEFVSKTGDAHRITSNGVDIEITVEVKVPANTVTNVKATYGIVELVDFHAPVNINATYGGIDATLAESALGKLQATTSYGQIYTNLDLKLTEKTQRDFFTSITAEPGKGPACILKSTYSNLYLRKKAS